MFTFWSILILSIWIITGVLGYAKYGYMWQLKEYRLYNMGDFLQRKYEQGLLLNYLFFSKRVLYPKLTNKMLIILIVSIAIEAFVLFSLFSIWTLLILIIIRFVIISGVVGLLYVPTILGKHFYIRKATRKLAQYPQLKSIGITGSYGKTTVKEILAHVVSTKFNVIKTPDHINTEIGIARFILKKDFKKIDIFIVEMGAYRSGDIKIIAEMVKPKIGILTAINEQHLALFRSIKQIQKTKYELLYSLSESGTAIVNSDNSLCREFLDKIKARVITFGVEKDNDPTYHITNTSMSASGIQFSHNNQSYSAPILGKHNAMNLMPVIATALQLGMKPVEIQSAFDTLTTEKYGMNVLRLDKALIINDSYNSNPDGFKMALELLENLREGRKTVVITRGITELGAKSEEIHKQIGENISKIADILVIISPDYLDSIISGTGNNIELHKIYDSNDLLKYIKQISTTDSIVLLENRLFTNIDNYLKNESKQYNYAVDK